MFKIFHQKPKDDSTNKSKKSNLLSKIYNLFKNVKNLKEIEKLLLSSDMDYKTVQDIIKNINFNNNNWREDLKKYLCSIIKTLNKEIDKNHLTIIEIIGVNGVGKTTFISKIAYKFKKQGYKILFAAADTFRAAAIEQLSFWAKKLDLNIVAQNPGADPAAVVFDSIDKSVKKNYDILIIDTAGRLQNKEQLMNQLKKINKVIEKKKDEYLNIKKIDIIKLLVLDANIGKNSINQLEVFNNIINIDAFVMTKLDSTAKGGIIFSILNKYSIPIFAISFGEQIEDYIDSSDKNFEEQVINFI